MSEQARVELMISDAGQVTIYGVHPVKGGEYEYSVTVDPEDAPAFASALGTTVDGIRAAWDQQSGAIIDAGEPKWLKSHGVRYHFNSWMTPS